MSKLLDELIYDSEDPSEFWGLVSDFGTADDFAATVKQIACIDVELIKERTGVYWAMRCLNDECLADEIPPHEQDTPPEPHWHFRKQQERGAEASWHADLASVLPFSVA